MFSKLWILFFMPLILTGCLATSPSLTSSYSTEKAFTPNLANGKSSLTLGLVQQVVKVGAAQEEIVSKLGSPNMVTSSADGGELWVYDAVSTTTSYTSSASGGNAGVAIGYGGIGGFFGGGNNNVQQSQSQSHRNLTVLIRFRNGKVSSYDSRASQF